MKSERESKRKGTEGGVEMRPHSRLIMDILEHTVCHSPQDSAEEQV